MVWPLHRSAFGSSEHGTCDVPGVGVECLQKSNEVRDRVGNNGLLTSTCKV